jgi:hypothetical protein
MSNSVILITVIASALLSPFLNYMIHSRCSRIKCGCIECDREVLEPDNQTQIPKNNNTNQL